jgi:hypothetical protein
LLGINLLFRDFANRNNLAVEVLSSRNSSGLGTCPLKGDMGGEYPMIRFLCPGCRSRIQAKDELAGQVRRCPRCQVAFRIPRPEFPTEEYLEAEWVEGAGPAETSVAPAAPGKTKIVPAPEEGIRTVEVPDKLVRTNVYLICDKASIYGVWENNGRGWQVKGSMGFVSARQNSDELPLEGDFQLVELKMRPVPGGMRLVGLMSYQLAPRYALLSLAKGDEDILSKVVGPGRLTRDQKSAIKLFILNKFMHPVWQEAREVLDFLNSPDYLTPGVG